MKDKDEEKPLNYRELRVIRKLFSLNLKSSFVELKRFTNSHGGMWREII